MGSSLTLQDHVNKTFSGAYFHIYNIRHIRTFLTKETTQILVHSLVISGIDYCNSLLFCLPVVNVAKFTELLRFQNSAARLISFTPRFHNYAGAEISSLAPR